MILDLFIDLGLALMIFYLLFNLALDEWRAPLTKKRFGSVLESMVQQEDAAAVVFVADCTADRLVQRLFHLQPVPVVRGEVRVLDGVQIEAPLVECYGKDCDRSKRS